LVSRFGMDRHELEAAADAVGTTNHLRLRMLHAMVPAAETLPAEDFAQSLLVGARIWAELRGRHESLTEFNVGGGVPPLGEDYAHRAFLRRLLAGLQEVAAEHGVAPPTLVFELGSLLAAEGGNHVFKVLQRKDNDSDTSVAGWALV